MEYVAFLRARRVLTWYGGILFGLLAIGLVLMFKNGSPELQMSHDRNPRIPFGVLLAGTAFSPLVIAAFLGVGLDAEYRTTAIAWTRPLARLAIAARYIAVDFGAMFVAWMIGLVVALVPLFALGLGKYVVYDTVGLSMIGLVLGCAAMWYGLIVFFAALVPGRGGAVAGFSWGYALVVPAISLIGFPPVIRTAIGLLNYLSPLAYLGSTAVDSNGGMSSQTLIAGTGLEHTIATWAIGAVALVAGAYIWSKREVPA